MITLTPHLFFGGNCQEAMTFYQRVFGGELTLTPFGEGPPDAHQDSKANSPDVYEKIMYSQLKGDLILSASDNPRLSEASNTGQFSLALTSTDATRMSEYFNALAQNGQITAPLIRQFWGDTFGMVTDSYGVSWMITITTPSGPAGEE